MPNHVCWLCKANTGHDLIGEARFVGPEAGVRPEQLACAAYECSICHGISVALFPFRNPGTSQCNVGRHILLRRVLSRSVDRRPHIDTRTIEPAEARTLVDCSCLRTKN